MLQYRHLVQFVADGAVDEVVSTVRFSTSFTSILYFVIHHAKVHKIADDSAKRSKLNKKDQKGSKAIKGCCQRADAIAKVRKMSEIRK